MTLNGLAHFITRHRYTLLFFSLVLFFTSIIGVKNLEFNSDYEVFFSEDDLTLITFKKFSSTYSKFENVAILLSYADGG